ncbi:DNA-binding anti-repressor SinI [Bacillus lacus]|uniref:DNA-binding anti-repressor SinI n=1 Tax=Metabacillus lacus TaxID=1983721 RepID=A0A7X2IZD4_9BACI|nr:anti-repressor SinI family protein [Metabacillus lacus]MRX72600.1 DNA-binding anti-repressor SinI [Metabacillus lacus]
MKIAESHEEYKLDTEWKELILSALEMGISPEEIRGFLKTYPREEITMSEYTK